MTGLSRSSYYYKGKARERPISDADLVAAMIVIKDEFPGYGSPRVTHELARRGCKANHKRVERLMKTNDLNVKIRRRFTCTTDSDHPHPIYPNLYRNVIPARLDVVWVADITYIALDDDAWAYVAVILDACSRKVVGYAISRRVDAKLALAALDAAIAARNPKPGLIHHSDRGVQYACNAYRKRLADRGFAGSMSALANPYDNAQAESFMKTLKVEEVYIAGYKTYEDVVARLPRFIEHVYNTKRIHSALGYVPPQEFEDQLAQDTAE
jgi:putative transposase